jgi:hypothetical protein
MKPMAKAARVLSTPRRTASSPDPILKMIADADLSLARLRRATDEQQTIRGKIGDENTRYPTIEGPLAFHRLFTTYTFESVGEFERNCRTATAGQRRVIKDATKSLKSGKLDAYQQKIAQRNIIQAKAELVQIPLLRAWGTREWRREKLRLERLWRSSGYDKARDRIGVAHMAAYDAVSAVVEAKPRTVEGCLALMKFVADRTMRENLILRLDTESDVSAPLYRAHDILKMFEKMPRRPTLQPFRRKTAA